MTGLAVHTDYYFALYRAQDIEKTMRTGVEPSQPSAACHAPNVATLNAIGPGFSEPSVKAEASSDGAELQLLSLDASSVHGFTTATSFDLTGGTTCRPVQLGQPVHTTTEPLFELDDDLVVEGTTRRAVSAVASSKLTRSSARNELEPGRLSMRSTKLDVLVRRLKAETSTIRQSKVSCGRVLLPYTNLPEEELSGRLLIGHWIAFYCDARPESSRVLFIDGHRERGHRVFEQVDGLENDGYKSHCYYLLCEQ